METVVERSEALQNFHTLPIFSHCSPQELVRLLPHVIEKDFSAGTTIFQADSHATHLYYLVSGKVALKSGERIAHETTEGFFGEEAAVGACNYLGDSIAQTECRCLVIPSVEIRAYLSKNETVSRGFYSSLFQHYSGQRNLFLPKEKKAKDEDKDLLPLHEKIGWVLAVLLPILVWFVGISYSFDLKTRLFMTVFSSITVMWVFRLMAEFIPCILGVLACVILGVAPTSEILQGFSSGEFFMAMSIFGVGAVLVSSGLTIRIVLLLLKYIPPTPLFQSIAMMIFGVTMTPVLPSANGRIGLVGPLITDMLTALDYVPKGRAATALVTAAFTGSTLFASVFLTSKPINFVVYGLLPPQVQEQFQWGGWFVGALVSGIVLFVLSIIFIMLMFRNQEKPNLSVQQIDAQLKLLGPLSKVEIIALFSIVIFIIGTAISSIHKVEPPWIALAVLALLLATDVLQRKEFHEKVDWSFILYLAGLIGLVKTMSSVGIDTMIAKNISGVGYLMKQNFGLFVMELFVIMGLVRLIVPNNATIAMFCTILLPIAQVNGVNPWVIGYIILTFSDGWIFRYQCTYYLLFLELTQKTELYNEWELFKFQILTNVFRLAAIIASIYYWKWMGMI